MKTTVNLGLKKPEGTDVVNIDDLNYNADIIDTELQKRALKTDIPTIPVQSVNGKTGAVTLVAVDVGAATSAQGIKADTALQSSQLGQAGGSARQDDLASHLADTTSYWEGKNSNSQSAPDNQYTVCALSEVKSNAHNFTWNDTTKELTVLNTGIYEIIISATLDKIDISVNNNNKGIDAIVAGSSVISAFDYAWYAISDIKTLTAIKLCDITAGSKLQFRVFQKSGGAKTIFSGAYMNLRRVG